MYFLSFIISLILTLALTPIIKHLALKGKIMDKPAGRKKDWRPVPLLGGWAIFLAVVAVLWWQKEALIVGDLNYGHWLGVLIGSLLIIICGSLDDKYNLSPAKQIIFPVLACLAVIAGGVGIEKITSPVAGLVWLDNWQVPLGFWFGQMHYFVVVADIFTFLWLMGMMYTTKLLDGVDGLVTGVAGIGSLIIFLFTMTTRYYQPDIALAALVLAAACAAFLVYNWTPAKIYLGEGGALWLGFILGVLSIISGGKIAVALLVMGVPILDVAWTITRRTLQGKNPFKSADRGHLHFRLQDSGLSKSQTVIVYYLCATVFGLSALFLQSTGKIISLSVLMVLILAVIVWFWRLDKKAKIN